ncbi:RNA polymerase sigma factor [Pseudozobellia thermophila]|uniref:RNA polymerase sigma factor, sigma-70 family n=1 Tax=Pseudozobellia thermophila TaxID=192903 RepID=A0A1M6C2V2_9FLAO|nr:sigma-70 family RNA polymerase sigma factor [Pseudozobellia thermophila]SHI55094.1 RNA polymerase sigma factor, sigma-70 family [Pseudozobellia thermophila]
MKDEQLISQLKNRDRDALKSVYDDYRSEFFKFAHRYQKTGVDLEDIFQDALIALYENAQAGKLDHLKSSVKTYLFSIGKFMLFKRFRDTKEIITDEAYIFDQKEKAVIEDVYHDPGPDEYQKRLVSNFKKLGEKCREILELFYLKGLKIEEIMTVQGYENKNVVKSQKSRCLKSLKDLIKRQDG